MAFVQQLFQLENDKYDTPCVFADLSCQHVTRMRHVACTSLQNIFTLSIKARFSKKKVIEHTVCIFIFSTILSETFFILRLTERDIIKNTQGPPKKCIHTLTKESSTLYNRVL